MESYEQARDRQRDAAAQRVSERTAERLGNEAALAEPGGLARVDTEERIAKRLDRLSRYVPGDVPPPTVPTAPPEALMQEAVERVEAGRARERAPSRPSCSRRSSSPPTSSASATSTPASPPRARSAA